MEVTSISDRELQVTSDMTLYFVLSGYVELIHNGRGVALKRGDIYLVNPYDLVGFLADGANHVLVAKIDLGQLYHLTKPLSPLYMKEAYDKISHTLAATFLEIESQQKGFEEIVEGYIYRLKGLFKRYLPARFSEKETNQAPGLNLKNKEIIDYINRHYKEELSLDSLADHFFISKYYLAHSFKEQVGLTVGNYIKEIRLIHSHLLIEQTTLSMIEIANETGFSNVRSFSEGFKQKYGLTPVTYRQELLQDTSSPLSGEKGNELGALQILNSFAGIDGLTRFDKKEIKEINAEIFPNVKKSPLPSTHIFVRLKDVTSGTQLDLIEKMGVAKFVSVTDVLTIMNLRLVDKSVSYESERLIHVFKEIIKRGLTPYIQISFVDYEKLRDITEDDHLFYDIFNRLAFDLEREFKDMTDWQFEFRCFYELKRAGKLCHPVKDIIPRFKNIGQTLVHLPVQPSLEELPAKSENSASIIDDMARVKEYDYEEVVGLLTEPKYIDIISENINIKMQGNVVKRMEQLEVDTYYQQFTDLVYANQMLWLFMYNLTKTTLTFEPMSLDGTPLFTYFPESMSQKLSAVSPTNIRRDMWYAYQFRGRLFETMVFNTEFCVITKQGDNYRILAIYPEKEVIETLFKRDIATEQEATMGLTIKFKELSGTYQIIEQKITPEIKNRVNKTGDIMNSEKLSSELIAYLDDMSQPMISLNEQEITGEYDLKLTLPIFSIVYVELNRLY